MAEQLTEPGRETEGGAAEDAVEKRAYTSPPPLEVSATGLGRADRGEDAEREAIFELDSVSVAYSGNPAVREIGFEIA